MKPTILASVLSVLIVAAFVGAGIWASNRSPAKPDPLDMWNAEIDRQLAAVQLQEQATYERMMRLSLGDATVDLYSRCMLDPPKHLQNQGRCQTALAKVERWKKERSAAEAKEKAEW